MVYECLTNINLTKIIVEIKFILSKNSESDKQIE